MPAASVARVVKQTSVDASDPFSRGMVMIEHKIRNLEKRKSRLDTIKEQQNGGKELESEQLEALSKYDEVIAHLDLARELTKQLNSINEEFTRSQKKQAKKDAAEKAQQELARTKEILMMQEVLTNMGTDTVREELLSGKAKVTLTEEELQSIDELYIALTPKRDEPLAFVDLFGVAADTLQSLADGKNKKGFGTTYKALKDKLMELATSGYFDSAEAPPAVETIVEAPVEQIPEIQPEVIPEPMETFQPTTVTQVEEQMTQNLPSQIDTTFYTPSHLKVFKSGTIDFMQENEIDTPEVSDQPSAIPTMTFANPSYDQPSQPIDQPYQNQQTDEEKGWNTVPSSHIDTSNDTINASNTWSNNQAMMDNNMTQNTGSGDDWATQTEHWQQTQNTHNDGFITAGGNRGRGGRGRGGGSSGDRDRNNKGGYRGGRGSQSGRGGYNRDREGGGYNRGDGSNYKGDRSEGGGYRGDRERNDFNRENNYYKDQNSGGSYQNGYQQRGGGNRGQRSNQSDRSDRPGGRGRGGRGGGGFRGGNQSGGYRQ